MMRPFFEWSRVGAGGRGPGWVLLVAAVVLHWCQL